jgi:hypothetical protein
MRWILAACLLTLCIASVGCQTTGSATAQTPDKLEANALLKSQRVPFEDRPAFYSSLVENGKLSPEAATRLIKDWQKTSAALRQQYYHSQQMPVAGGGIATQPYYGGGGGGLVPIPQRQTQIVYPATHTMPRVAPYIYVR